MNRHIVYGNGESRAQLSGPVNPSGFTTWGCNAIYRDFTLDNLVSVDYNMQQEVYESGYAFKNKCWFTDWSVLPNFDASLMKMAWADSDGTIFETARLSKTDCVVQGKTRELVESNILDAMSQNPNLVEKDLRQKMEKDIGLYITWVDKDDQVMEIDYPRGWSAGNTVYMLGFDGSSYSENLNNIYKGSKNYLPEESRGLNTINWDNQFKILQKEFPDVKFYKVGTDLTYDDLYKNIR